MILRSIAFSFTALIFLLGNRPSFTSDIASDPHKPQIPYYERNEQGLYFFTSSKCSSCHGHDMNKYALYTESGEDVNIKDDWSGSMMANAFIDPFWQAKVRHEVLTFPQHKAAIESKCLNCHAPMGKYQQYHTLGTEMTFEEAVLDTLARDGVSCMACHSMTDKDIFTDPGGFLNYNLDSVVYGPYEEPFGVTMQQYSGILPEFGKHIKHSIMCGKCHTLVTDVLDEDGNPTGDVFYEQTVYQEWLNSDFAKDNISCQSCHIPKANSPVVIASGVNGMDARYPFGLHEMVGANLLMIDLIKNNANELGAKASQANFDSTLQYTMKMLIKNSVRANLSWQGHDNDTMQISYKITNLSGHKFPTGYPSRRAFVQFKVIDLNDNETIFESGQLDNDGNLVEPMNGFQAHYTMINNSDQTQIYEMVPGNILGLPTTILTTAATVLKDNRLPPKGFVLDHFTKDTVSISDDAIQDINFNFEGSEEGSGTDEILFKVAAKGSGKYKVIASIYYQTVSPKWLAPMFNWTDPLIDRFKMMYENAKFKSVLIQTDTLNMINLERIAIPTSDIRIYPNPTPSKSLVNISMGSGMDNIRLISATGQKMDRKIIDNQFESPELPGIYWIIDVRKNQVCPNPLIVL